MSQKDWVRVWLPVDQKTCANCTHKKHGSAMYDEMRDGELKWPHWCPALAVENAELKERSKAAEGAISRIKALEPNDDGFVRLHDVQKAIAKDDGFGNAEDFNVTDADISYMDDLERCAAHLAACSYARDAVSHGAKVDAALDRLRATWKNAAVPPEVVVLDA